MPLCNVISLFPIVVNHVFAITRSNVLANSTTLSPSSFLSPSPMLPCEFDSLPFIPTCPFSSTPILTVSACLVALSQMFRKVCLFPLLLGLRNDGRITLHRTPAHQRRMANVDHRLARWRHRRRNRILHCRPLFRPKGEEDGLREHLVLFRLRALHAQSLQ